MKVSQKFLVIDILILLQVSKISYPIFFVAKDSIVAYHRFALGRLS